MSAVGRQVAQALVTLLDGFPDHLERPLLNALEPLSVSLKKDQNDFFEWQVTLMQSLIDRGPALEFYLTDTVDPELAFLPTTLCPLLDIPPEYPDDIEGVHPYPLLNFMHVVLSEIGRGIIYREDLGPVLASLWNRFADAMKVFEADTDPFRGSKGQGCCRDILGALQILDEYAQTGEARQLARGMERFLLGCELLEDLFLRTSAVTLESGPAGLPLLDWPVHSIFAVGDDLLEVSALEQCLTHCLEQVRKLAEEFRLKRSMVLAGRSQLFFRCEAVTEALSICVQVLDECLAEPDSATVGDRTARTLAEVGQMLGDTLEYLADQEMAGHRSQCPRCGGELPEQGGNCPSCQAVVPPQASLNDEPLPEEFIGKLIANCEAVMNETADPLALAPWVVQGKKRLMAVEPLLKGLDAEQYAELFSGLEQYRSGVESLEVFLDEKRLRQLTAGLRPLVEARRLLLQVRARLP